MLQVGCVSCSVLHLVGIDAFVGLDASALALNLNDPALAACRVCTLSSVSFWVRVVMSSADNVKAELSAPLLTLGAWWCPSFVLIASGGGGLTLLVVVIAAVMSLVFVGVACAWLCGSWISLGAAMDVRQCS